MKKRVLSMFAMLTLMATAMFAGDITGKWSGEVEGRNGKRTQTFNFKTEGDKLTGTMLGMGGNEVQIQDGKITGEDVSFSVTVEFNGNSRKMDYTGKVVGDQINLKTGQGDRAREFSVKRATS